MRHLLVLLVTAGVLIVGNAAEADQPNNTKNKTPVPPSPAPAPAPKPVPPAPKPVPPAPKPAPPAPKPVPPPPRVNPNGESFNRTQGQVLQSVNGGSQTSLSPYGYVANRFPTALGNPWNNPFPFISPFVWQPTYFAPVYPVFPYGRGGYAGYGPSAVWPGYYSPLGALNGFGSSYQPTFSGFAPGFAMPMAGFNNGFGQPADDNNNNNNNDKPVVGRPLFNNN